MDPLDQARFDRIVKLEPAALTRDEIIFLQARRSYLSDEQQKLYAGVLKGAVPAAPEAKLEKTVKELQTQAKELGIETKGLNKDELVNAIDTVLGPANAENPE